ncbi:MAG: hypothetical protein ACK4L8_16800 [Nitrincola lacisaponensis]|uniref:hypothetical protein n=1 Tax=Nitrincola lacisaponensis TaxID=267850 RepID=UPI00391BC708
MAISHQDIKLKVVPGTLKYGPYSDDGHGNLVDDKGLRVGNIDYDTGHLTDLDIFDAACNHTESIGEPSLRLYGWGDRPQGSSEITTTPPDTRLSLFNTGKDNQADEELKALAESECVKNHGAEDWNTMFSGDQEAYIQTWMDGYLAAKADAEKDARRYQWLRNGNAYAPEEQCITGGPELDAAIDKWIEEDME